jgi:peptidoglycan pentaglycine glycine transferase (the first glycine)
MEQINWDKSLLDQPTFHIFQTEEWAELKSGYGWKSTPYSWETGFKPAAKAMVLERSSKLLLKVISAKVLYVPRGPLVDWFDISQADNVLKELEHICRDRKAIFIKIDPEVLIGRGIPGEDTNISDASGEYLKGLLISRGWVYSREQIQFQNSVWLDLMEGEEKILTRMKQKTRYNIRLAGKKGLTIRRGGIEDLEKLFQLYAQTSLRDGFTIRNKQYYLDVWMKFMNVGMAAPLIAEYQGTLLAGLFLFWLGKKAWYLYGMSSDEHRDLMPNYALQWEAIRFARGMGCKVYDLWGAPDEFNDKDRMSGVFKFKQGLGGEVVRLIGAWDYPANLYSYNAYTKILPAVMSMMRKKGKKDTIQEAGE